ncbi:Gfo/Idh/MocA family protein [Actinocatenispora rupis]|uniref:Oxidoreductase n=1 Tax=Actinocatenispora rupis TaxID=519421 RepID=A0A8J3NAU2_9ACTN|nr:Gfo/Idh/MocA family oxidoreductase [Actinocatenispora rupis]GID09907.1 oxidoreductase [Actinocatenispora rupis]
MSGWALVPGTAPLRGVLVGAGGLGPFWAKELLASADTELAGWVDLDERRAVDGAARLGVTGLPTGPSLAAMLDAEAPDFVVNVTAPLAHREVTVTALEHGVPVLSEKPMAPTMAQAREMVAAADRAGVLFMVSQNRRYLPALVAYRDTVGRLGELASVSCDFYLGHHVGPDHFLFTLDQPLLLDMAIHLFDGARAITGTDPVSVYCESYNPRFSWFPGAAAANAVFEMTGGLRFVLNGSWCADGFQTSWTGSWRTVGAHGTAAWDGETAPRAEPAPGARITATAPDPGGTPEGRFHGLAAALREFVAALRTGATPQGECHDNLRSLAMCHAAVESAATGTRVPVA